MDPIILDHKKDFLLNLLNNNYSNETIYNYKRDLSLFELFLTFKNIEFENIGKNDIVIFKDFLRTGEYINILKLDTNNVHNFSKDSKGNLSPRSINRVLSSLRTYIRYLIDFDLDFPISPEVIKLIKTEKKSSQVAEFDELIRLIEFPSIYEKNDFVKLRNRAILETLFSTGMRISELVSLNKDQINDDGKIYVLGKGRKQRFVYLTERAKKNIFNYLELRNDENNALFVPIRGGRNGNVNSRISTNYIQDKISFYRKKIGIIVPTSAHSLRHGFATYLAEKGANAVAIQILLGHESLQTTNKYMHASDKYAEETHKKYHPLKE
jgi:integrase/recombinase XerD